jgi:hypothetical protein
MEELVSDQRQRVADFLEKGDRAGADRAKALLASFERSLNVAYHALVAQRRSRGVLE